MDAGHSPWRVPRAEALAAVGNLKEMLIKEDFCSLARKMNSVKGEYIQHIRPLGGMRMTPPGGKKTFNQRFLKVNKL